jgi:hypothetical protein
MTMVLIGSVRTIPLFKSIRAETDKLTPVRTTIHNSTKKRSGVSPPAPRMGPSAYRTEKKILQPDRAQLDTARTTPGEVSKAASTQGSPFPLILAYNAIVLWSKLLGFDSLNPPIS